MRKIVQVFVCVSQNLPPKGKIYSKIKRERAIIQFKLIYLILRLADLSFRFVAPGFDPHQEQLLKLRNH